jgi:adenylate cyclase class 2
MNKEIEIKVKIQDSRELEKLLAKDGKFKFESKQMDQYYTPAHRDFMAQKPVEEWLRVRDEEGTYSINYKKFDYSNSSRANYCEEYEIKVESAEELKKILQLLDFKLLTDVDKLRKCWDLGDYEIALDTVKNLGDFVEIEYKADSSSADPKKITDEMVAFLKNVGCGEITRCYRGYPSLLLFPEDPDNEVV